MNKFREMYKEAMSAEAPSQKLAEKTLAAMETGRKPSIAARRYRWKLIIPVAALLALTMATAATAIVSKLLKPSEIAGMMGDDVLSASFEGGEAMDINMSIESDGYTFTLLAIMTGSDLKDKNLFGSAEQASDERTYAVFAIEHGDMGKLIDDGGFVRATDFYAAFMVKGLKPWLVNSTSMNGGFYATMANGIIYYIAESDAVEMFADRGIYFVICRGAAIYDRDAIIYDEATGEIMANPGYKGPCAVFEVPLDKSLADPQKAEKYLEGIGYYRTPHEPGGDFWPEADQIAGPASREEWLKWKAEDRIEFFMSFDWENAAAVDSTLEELGIDENGMITYSGFIEYYEWRGPPMSVLFEDCFEEGKTAQSQIVEMRLRWDETDRDYAVMGIRYSIDENGKITGVVVLPEDRRTIAELETF